AHIGATNHTTLAAYQAVVSGREAASISLDPLYTSTTDVHIPCTSPNIGAGVVIATVTNDLDGDARSATEAGEIGADETTSRGTPANTATALSAITGDCSTIGVSFTAAAGSPDGYLVIRSTSAAAVTNPANFTTYTTGAAYGSDFVAYSGPSTS